MIFQRVRKYETGILISSQPDRIYQHRPGSLCKQNIKVKDFNAILKIRTNVSVVSLDWEAVNLIFLSMLLVPKLLTLSMTKYLCLS